ncbi:MAG TPA: AMP-binding protein, partial [Jatrophihabitantaceae bacterium]|nr:AMP-binding protein [Jatrophihabitantaceae bacterium]
MRELHVASNVTSLTENNTADFVFANAQTRPDHVALRRRVSGTWTDVTSAQFADEVIGAAKGLVAAGIQHGDRVAVMSKTRYEWTVVDMALFTVGAVVVPIYETSSAEQVEWILSDSGARGAFVETADHAAVVESVQAKAPDLANVWTFDNGDLDKLIASGAEVSEDEVTKRREAVQLDDAASIIYTSGTTGRPKGCELTHRNFLYDATATTEGLDELFGPDQSTLLFLPLAHVFARI